MFAFSSAILHQNSRPHKRCRVYSQRSSAAELPVVVPTSNAAAEQPDPSLFLTWAPNAYEIQLTQLFPESCGIWLALKQFGSKRCDFF